MPTYMICISILAAAALIGAAVMCAMRCQGRNGRARKGISGCECCQDQAAELERPVI